MEARITNISIVGRVYLDSKKNGAAPWEVAQVQKVFFPFFNFLVSLSLFLNKFSCLILCFLVLFFMFLEFKVGYGGGES